MVLVKHKKSLFFFLIFLLVCLAAGAVAYGALWRKPLSTGLAKPTLAADSPALVMQQAVASTPAATLSPAADSASRSAASVEQQALCNGPQTMTLLAVGIDYQSKGNDYLYGLGDVIRIVRIDFIRPSVAVLAIPRDLRVYIPGLEDRGIDYGKINQSYFFGTPGMGYYPGKAGGAGLMADTLYYNFGLYPDHYGVISMYSLEKLINAVGGIDVTLDQAVDGNVNGSDNGFYGIGTHHFDGATAVLFSRIREGYSDLDRIDNQTVVLNALYKKMMSEEVRPKLIQILADFILSNQVLTDFSPADLPMFMCLAQQIERKDIQFVTLPSDTFKAETLLDSNGKDYVFYFIPDLEKINQVFHNFTEGIWP